ncbi:MAG: 23S rRNA (uracil(1939)-C(5))-methyltransferase RlmD [Deltaproteobacteria bacterium]|nr:23S rRNA (uracil(1939)-C(5))-methyltransferase RlmD [Deltaproteobacteria bacterium]
MRENDVIRFGAGPKNTSPSGTGVTVRSRQLAFGGDAVGEVTESPSNSELLGITAFVPFVVPGETVRVRVTEEKKRYLRGDLLDVLTPSEDRTEPTCKVFGSCGGCELQHIRYERQLELKREMIRGSLAAARLGMDVLDAVQPIIPSAPYNYRRRVSLHVDSRGTVGFYRANTRSVVMTDRCPISVDAINDVFPGAREFGAEVGGRITSIQLEADQNGVIAVLKTPSDLQTREREGILQKARKHFDSAVLMSGNREVGGFGRQILELPLNESRTLLFTIPAGYFSQVNWEVNLELVRYVAEQSAVVHGQDVLDLYSGAGNFSLPLAKLGGKVVGVEVDTRLVALGRQMVSKYRLERQLTFVEGSVEAFLKSDKRQKRYDVIVADPPRSGLGGASELLPDSERFVLISCHLPSLVRDLKQLQELGYEATSIQPFDMFAQTSYTEVVAVFRRG